MSGPGRDEHDDPTRATRRVRAYRAGDEATAATRAGEEPPTAVTRRAAGAPPRRLEPLAPEPGPARPLPPPERWRHLTPPPAPPAPRGRPVAEAPRRAAPPPRPRGRRGAPAPPPPRRRRRLRPLRFLLRLTALAVVLALAAAAVFVLTADEPRRAVERGRDVAGRVVDRARGVAASVPRATCPDGLARCRSVRGRIVFVEAVDPDGDGDLHVVIADGSVTAPGLTSVDVRPGLRPERDPRVGEQASAAGQVQRGSFAQAQVHAVEFTVSGG